MNLSPTLYQLAVTVAILLYTQFLILFAQTGGVTNCFSIEPSKQENRKRSCQLFFVISVVLLFSLLLLIVLREKYPKDTVLVIAVLYSIAVYSITRNYYDTADTTDNDLEKYRQQSENEYLD